MKSDTSRELESWDPTDTATEMSVGGQDSIFSDCAHVEILDKVPFGKSDNDDGESGTE
jgi:hypothetical protein